MLGHESLDTLRHYAPSTELRTGKHTITDLKSAHASATRGRKMEIDKKNALERAQGFGYQGPRKCEVNVKPMSKLLYLDYNCFQRSFDDQRQVRIRIESAACEAIFSFAVLGRVRLIWSFIHQDENALCPFLDRKIEVLKLSELCKVQVAPEEETLDRAEVLVRKHRVGPKDALHLACAIRAKAHAFITCDDALRRKTAGKLGRLLIQYPQEYLTIEA